MEEVGIGEAGGFEVGGTYGGRAGFLFFAEHGFVEPHFRKGREAPLLAHAGRGVERGAAGLAVVFADLAFEAENLKGGAGIGTQFALREHVAPAQFHVLLGVESGDFHSGTAGKADEGKAEKEKAVAAAGRLIHRAERVKKNPQSRRLWG